MNIEIATNEYRDLLDILHIAGAVMAGHRTEGDVRTERHRALIQKLYARTAHEGLDRLIAYNEISKTYSPTVEFEENTLAHAILREFGDHLFWDALINRLSVRDAAEIAGGIRHLNEMSESDREEVEGPIRQRYIREFGTNGVANVTVLERFSLGEGMPAKTSD